MSPSWSGEREYAEPEHARNMLQPLPFAPIGDLGEGVFGRIHGKVMPMREVGVLIAPISGRSCAIYIVHIEGNYSGFRQHFGERRGAPFVVVESGHRAVVDPIYACLRLRYDKPVSRPNIHACTAGEVDLLQRLAVPPMAADGREASFTFQEARLEPGSMVTACGAGTREPDPQAAPGDLYRGVPRTRLAISGTPKALIAISNDPALV